MKKTFPLFFLIIACLTSKAQDERIQYFPRHTDRPDKLPKKKDIWIFIMAGQSNMAGRGLVQPPDTIPNSRILTINKNNEIILAKEPLHFYEPNLTGLDCGVAFARRLLQEIDPSITILLVPAAVGGSSSHQWLGDSVYRDVKLLSNFTTRVNTVKKYGTVKGILWHQGESDTNPRRIPGYDDRIRKLFGNFRKICDDATLPIVIGELGSFSDNQTNWNLINDAIHRYAATDKNAFVVDTDDLPSKDDKIHFNSEGQRKMGERMAVKFLEISRR